MGTNDNLSPSVPGHEVGTNGDIILKDVPLCPHGSPGGGETLADKESKATSTGMSFAPPLLPYQLVFPFLADSHEPELATPWQRLGIARSTYFARRRLRRAVAAAFELGRRRKHVMPPPPARGPRPFHPTRAEAGELEAIAARVGRLSVSHRSPEKFFEDRSELAFELRALAARANQRRTTCRG
jgi:hypothetical protein